MIDTYTYTPEDTSDASRVLAKQASWLDKGHISDKKWYRKYRNWAEFWRDTTKSSLYGLSAKLDVPTDEVVVDESLSKYPPTLGTVMPPNKTGVKKKVLVNAGPTDPLAQLQNQLASLYQQEAAAGRANFTSNYDFSGMVNARNQGMAQALRQKAAGMGVQGAYQGTMDAAAQARQTLIDQSMAAYRPMAYQGQQQVQANTDQLLTAIAQADFEGRRSIAGAGRGA